MPLPTQPPSKNNRQPKGVPAGGEFAPTVHSEPDVNLTPRKHFAFTEEDSETDILRDAPSTDGGTGNEPANDILDTPEDPEVETPLPQPTTRLPHRPIDGLPIHPVHPATGRPPAAPAAVDAGQRKASQDIIFTAAKSHATYLLYARTISISSDHRGNLRVDDVADQSGKSISIKHPEGETPLAKSLQLEINANVPGGRGLPAHHVLDTLKSASIDVASMLKGEIKVVGLGMAPRT